MDLIAAAPEGLALIERMDELAAELGLRIKTDRTGRKYYPAESEAGLTFSIGVGIDASRRTANINMLALREKGADALADQLAAKLREITGLPITAPSWPTVPCELLVRDWTRTRDEVIEPYFRARGVHAG